MSPRQIFSRWSGATLDIPWMRVALVVLLAVRGVDGTILLHRDEVGSRRTVGPAAPAVSKPEVGD